MQEIWARDRAIYLWFVVPLMLISLGYSGWVLRREMALLDDTSTAAETAPKPTGYVPPLRISY